MSIEHDLSHRDRIQMRRAIISVSDKTGLVDLARALISNGVELISTGSTAKTIADAGLKVTQVSDVTGFQETLDGRVKTLHPKIHGGLLADLRRSSHREQLADLAIKPFELLVVNLYPFVEAIAGGATGEDAIEQIDIGGPAMVRAAAKNHANVTVITNPGDYPKLLESVTAGGTTLAQRKEYAYKAFAHTASYDTAVSSWMESQLVTKAENRNPDFESELKVTANLHSVLRYGENSHQAAAVYKLGTSLPGLAQARQLGGKEMSYNNFVDADSALRAAYDFGEPAVAIIKHANPCGIATAKDIATAHQLAHACDPVSAFGGVVASNRIVTAAMATQIAEVFTEVVAAPGFELEALEILTAKTNLRILELRAGYQLPDKEIRQISGGLLVQESDYFEAVSHTDWKLVAGRRPNNILTADLIFAWKACRSVKSNAILLASGGASVGIGMGQVNRVDSCVLAVNRAGSRAAGSVAASDAFFPFADGLQVLLDAGITAVVQPGGSVRDDEVIAAAKAAGISMYFTGQRHFFH